jgi:UDP-N-acetylmuramoyl-L-alanyl-D-glutamate--2,6-diaminopimelate ligase
VTQKALSTSGTSLRDLLAGDAQIIGSPDIRAGGCTSQARHVRAGDVFVAITDADEDGHDDAAEAARRGAAAVICERPLPLFDISQFIVRDSRAAYGQLCQALVGNPSQQLNVIGVSGTCGKTTVARLLTSIFRQAGAHAAVLDSFGYDGGCEDRPPAAEGLTPPYLARSLAEMVATGATHAIVEANSREISRCALSGIALDAACITHISRGSLDWHGSVENYRRAERRIIERASPDAVAILNADDPFSMQILAELDRPALTFGMRQPAEITAEVIEQHINEQIFMLTAGDESVGVRTEIIGDHHIYNCLAAAATSLAYGIELVSIARGLEAVPRLPGRMERVMCGQDFAVFVDAARSPDALRACLKAARAVTSGRVICVFGPHGERDTVERPVMGRVVGASADLAIITSGDPLGELPASDLLAVRRGFAEPKAAEMIVNRAEAISFALEAAQPGDTVVVAGMGDECYAAFGDNDPSWTDRAIVQHALQQATRVAVFPRLAA